MGEPIRLFIVDDHEVVRDGLAALFDAQADIEVVGTAGNVQQAIERIPAVRPDVALVDMQLPDGSGADIVGAVRERSEETACLVLTSFTQDEALFQAVSAGAAGFVLKQIRSKELVDCVRRIAAGETLIDDAARERVRERVALGESDPKLASLSPQERVLLGHLASGMTNREIADKMFLAEKTIKNYVSNLLLKLGMEHRSGAAAYAARVQERKNLTLDTPDDQHGAIRY